MRKESMFRSNKTATPPADSGHLVPTKVKREIDKVKRELIPVTPTGKLLIGLRKVLVKMSTADENGSRYFISGEQMKLVKVPAVQQVKEGEFASYQGEGYAKVGVSLRTGDMIYKHIHFSINFRDCLNENGLPDVEFLDPTELTEIDRHHPEVSEL